MKRKGEDSNDGGLVAGGGPKNKKSKGRMNRMMENMNMMGGTGACCSGGLRAAVAVGPPAMATCGPPWPSQGGRSTAPWVPRTAVWEILLS